MKNFLLVIVLLLFVTIIYSQDATWSTANGSPCAPVGSNGDPNGHTQADAGLTVGDLCRGGGIGQGSGADFNSNAFNASSYANAVNLDECLTWSYSVDAGSTYEPMTMEFELDRSNTGPADYQLDMDEGSGFFSIESGTISTGSACISSDISGSTLVGPITVDFRLCAWNASNTSLGTMDIEEGDKCSGFDGMGLFGNLTMPVELISFTAKKSSDTAILNWTTATEINNEYFEIQHSIDGQHFSVIGTKKGKGTTSITQNYEFSAPLLIGSNNFFRLRQVDYDGKFEYSPVVVVSSSDNKTTVRRVFVQSQSELSVSGAIDSDYIIRDVSGRILGKGQVISHEMINISSLNNGLYFLSINEGSKVKTYRFIK